jgi:hypothetical protein
MKYTLKDEDGTPFEVGYKLYGNEPLFWLQSDKTNEVITLHLTPQQLRDLIGKIELLCAAQEQGSAGT